MHGHHGHCHRESRGEQRRTKRPLMIRIPEYASQDHDDPVGVFRADNLVAILVVVPQTTVPAARWPARPANTGVRCSRRRWTSGYKRAERT